MSANFIDLNKTKKSVIKLSRPGKYVAFVENTSGNFVFEINAENVDLEIYGLFHGKKSEEFKVHTVQHHKSSNSKSNLLIRGVFDDDSKFHYTGLVKIDKKAQKSHAYQKNQNLILSEGVFVESEPFLEIEANDVFCTHGSTTGKINEDQLYYMTSRGVNREEAKKLIVQGFLEFVRQQSHQE
ncbi:MAG: SufD family Fe-S cluster assembly protein [Microgenomates group bacterium]|jgi:Fe-S cluster assembly protein SufD